MKWGSFVAGRVSVPNWGLVGEEDVLITKGTEGTKEERLIEDNSPYRVRGFQAWDNPVA